MASIFLFKGGEVTTCTKETIEGHVVLVPATFQEAAELATVKDGAVFDVKAVDNVRTHKQNAALHVYCRLLAEALNDAGYDFNALLEGLGRSVPIPWTDKLVKEYLWRPVQKALTGKDSTTEVKTADPGDIFNSLSRKISEVTGVYVDFPNNRG